MCFLIGHHGACGHRNADIITTFGETFSPFEQEQLNDIAMQVFVALLLCWASCWCLVSSDAVVVDLDAVRKCLNQKNENRKFQRHLKQKRLYMQLGNHSLEGFNTLPPYYIQQVVLLAQCVEMLHKELFWTRWLLRFLEFTNLYALSCFFFFFSLQRTKL